MQHYLLVKKLILQGNIVLAQELLEHWCHSTLHDKKYASSLFSKLLVMVNNERSDYLSLFTLLLKIYGTTPLIDGCLVHIFARNFEGKPEILKEYLDIISYANTCESILMNCKNKCKLVSALKSKQIAEDLFSMKNKISECESILQLESYLDEPTIHYLEKLSSEELKVDNVLYCENSDGLNIAEVRIDPVGWAIFGNKLLLRTKMLFYSSFATIFLFLSLIFEISVFQDTSSQNELQSAFEYFFITICLFGSGWYIMDVVNRLQSKKMFGNWIFRIIAFVSILAIFGKRCHSLYLSRIPSPGMPDANPSDSEKMVLSSLLLFALLSAVVISMILWLEASLLLSYIRRRPGSGHSCLGFACTFCIVSSAFFISISPRS